MAKFLSLDFWGTLAVFNPLYAAARTRYLADLFGLPADEAHAHYQYVKRGLDHDAEHSGASATPLGAVKLLLRGMQVSRDATSVVADIERLVRDNPPLLHPAIPDLLHRLKEKGVIVGVASNTNFMAGSFVQSIFRLPWDFAVYSDELGVSKPDPDFFRAVVRRAVEAGGHVGPVDLVGKAPEVLHIGDHSICDVRGAQAIGMEGALTKSPEQTVLLLENLLQNC